MNSTSHCDLPHACSQPPYSLDETDAETPPLLPLGATRNDLLRLIDFAGGSVAVSGTCGRLVKCYICWTSADHWITRGCMAICWKSTAEIAEQLSLSPETVRRAHRLLVDMGLVRDMSRGDGWRGVVYRDGGRTVYGVDLSPLAALYPALVEAAERKRQQAEDLRRLRERLSRGKTALRREIERMVRLGAPDTVTATARPVLEGLPPRPSRLNDTTILATHLRDCEQALLSLSEAEPATRATVDSAQRSDNPAATPPNPENPRVTVPGHPKMPDAVHAFDRPLITNYESRTKVYENYNSPDVRQVPPGRAEPPGGPERKEGSARVARRAQPAAGIASGGERRSGAADTLHPDPERLHRAAGEEVRFMVETLADDGPANDVAFIRAASARRVGLGISDSLWNAAMIGLGPYPAAVAVTLCDRKRSDPVNPVRVPGAWLTGILRKRMRGETVDFIKPVDWLLARGPEAPAVSVAADPPETVFLPAAAPPPEHSSVWLADKERASLPGSAPERPVSPERLRLLAEEIASKAGRNGRGTAARPRCEG